MSWLFSRDFFRDQAALAMHATHALREKPLTLS
jgi:hypothetical protein